MESTVVEKQMLQVHILVYMDPFSNLPFTVPSAIYFDLKVYVYYCVAGTWDQWLVTRIIYLYSKGRFYRVTERQS